MLTLSACSTAPIGVPIKPVVSKELVEPCEALPELAVKIGEDMRGALLLNRAKSQKIHETCMERHKAVLKAVGVTP